jgi:hypothetical protein
MEKVYAVLTLFWFLGFLLGFPYFLWSICSKRPEEVEINPRIHET